MSVTVRISGDRADRWAAIPGETRWVDYTCEQVGEDLVVYLQTFRRVRERFDAEADVLLWKPGTTGVARHYAAGEWDAVEGRDRVWPPTEVTTVPRRRRA